MNPNPSSEQQNAVRELEAILAMARRHSYTPEQTCQVLEALIQPAAPPPQPSPRPERMMAANPKSQMGSPHTDGPHTERISCHWKIDPSKYDACVPVAPAPPSVPMVCSLCGGPAYRDGEVWRHIGTNVDGSPVLVICDKYGYPIEVKPAPSVPSGARRMLGNRDSRPIVLEHWAEHDETPECAIEHFPYVKACQPKVDAQPAPEPAKPTVVEWKEDRPSTDYLFLDGNHMGDVSQFSDGFIAYWYPSSSGKRSPINGVLCLTKGDARGSLIAFFKQQGEIVSKPPAPEPTAPRITVSSFMARWKPYLSYNEEQEMRRMLEQLSDQAVMGLRDNEREG